MFIDIHTLVFVLGITHLIQVAVFYQQFKINKNFHGIGWFLLWSIAEVIGFSGMLFRNIPIVHSASIIVQNTSIFVGTIFIYIGILRFLERSVNRKGILFFTILYFLAICYFTLVDDNILMRSVVINIGLAATALSTAYVLFTQKNSSITSTAFFNAVIFIIHGVIFASRTVMLVSGFPIDDFFKPTLFNFMPFVDALIVSLLWTFGFIMMLNQRLNAENREDKENLELIFNTSPDAVSITRLVDGNYISINDGFTKLTGFTRDDVIGKSSIDLNIWKNPEDRQNIVTMLKEKDFCENIESIFQHKNGKLIIGIFSAKIITLQGNPHLISVTRDITERKQAEDALSASRTQLSDVIEFLPDAMFAIDKEKRVIIWNKAIEKMTGISSAEMIGKGDYAYTIPFYGEARPLMMNLIFDNQVKVIENYPGIKREGDILSSEVFCNALYNNKGAWVFAKASPLHDQFGNIIGAIEIVRDITERKNMEEALLESEEKFRYMTENSSDIIWHLDENYRFDYISPADERMRGFSRDEVIGKEIWTMFKPEGAEFVRKLKKQREEYEEKGIRTGPFRYELEQKCKDESWIWTEINVMPHHDVNGKLVGLHGVTRDVSERKRNEEKITSLLAEKELILQEVHHRIRNNMTTINSLLSLQSGNMKDPSAIEALNDAKRRIQSMMVLYDKLYQSSNTTEISVSEYFPALIDQIIHNFPNSGIVKIEKKIDSFILEAKLMSSLGIIINELLTNIMKYAFIERESGLITVTARKIEKLVSISIQDNGKGIPEGIDFTYSTVSDFDLLEC